MVLSHIWGLYTQPKTEWDRIDHDQESFFSSLLHVILLAFIPALSAYYSTVYLGWQIANGPVTTLSSQSGLVLAAAMYLALIAGVFALAALIKWMALNTAVYGGFCRALSGTLGNDSRRSRGPLLCGVSALHRSPYYDAHP